tara:strand:- start:446 stop:688 length:243 start_codon:yes stop_codon:yes gene_type:complete
MQVKVQRGDIFGALKQFRYLCEKDGLFRKLRSKQYYVKPSETKKRKKYIKALLSGDKRYDRQREKLEQARLKKQLAHGNN